MKDRTTEVLIIGAGPSGLTLSALLAQQGIKNIVIDKKPATQKFPAAHVLRPYSMNIFSSIGALEEINENIADICKKMDCVTWCSSFGGKEIGRIDMTAPTSDDFTKNGFFAINLAQSKLEPILLKSVKKSTNSEVIFNTEFLSIEGDLKNPTIQVKTHEDEQYLINAKWVVGADGANSKIRELLNIEMEGPGVLANFLNIHFEADLTDLLEDRAGPVHFVMSPGVNGTIITYDEKSHVYMINKTDLNHKEGEILDLLDKVIDDKDVKKTIKSMGHWDMHCEVAKNYRVDNFLLIGDAGHRFPPTGGLGLNTGVLDASNLAWKLAAIIKGKAKFDLIDTFEIECKEVATKNADDSMNNAFRLLLILEALGPFSSKDELETRLDSLNENEQKKLNEAIKAQESHFTSNGLMPTVFNSEHENSNLYPQDNYNFTIYSNDENYLNSVNENLDSDNDYKIITKKPIFQTDWLDKSVPHAFATRPDGLVFWMTKDKEFNFSNFTNSIEKQHGN